MTLTSEKVPPHCLGLPETLPLCSAMEISNFIYYSSCQYFNTSPSQYKWICLSIFISILKTPKQLGNSYLAGTRVIGHFSQGSSCQKARYWLSPSLCPHSILSLPTENDIFSPQWQAVQDELSSEVSAALLMTSWRNTPAFWPLLEPLKGLWDRKMQVK